MNFWAVTPLIRPTIGEKRRKIEKQRIFQILLISCIHVSLIDDKNVYDLKTKAFLKNLTILR